jgi:hypothetical protein
MSTQWQPSTGFEGGYARGATKRRTSSSGPARVSSRSAWCRSRRSWPAAPGPAPSHSIPNRPDLWFALAAPRTRGSLCVRRLAGEVCDRLRGGVDQGNEPRSLRPRLISAERFSRLLGQRRSHRPVRLSKQVQGALRAHRTVRTFGSWSRDRQTAMGDGTVARQNPPVGLNLCL